MATEPKCGNCVSCGYLCAIADEHSRVANFSVHEISPIKRATGLVISAPHPMRPGVHVDVVIHCFRGVADLNEECGPAYKGSPEETRKTLVLNTINKERHCDSWIKYVPGLSASQHLEAARLKELEQNDQRQHDQMKKLACKQHREMKRLQLWLTAVVILIMIVQIVVALISAYSSSVNYFLIK